MRRLLPAIGVALVALIALATPASAHAALERTRPAAGDILEASPREIELAFTEPVEAHDDSVKVFDATGARVATQPPEDFDGGRTIVVPIATLDEGGYVVTWKVVSADGHPISGGFTFRVGEDAVAVDASVVADLVSAQRASSALGVVAGVIRFAVFGALLALVGGAAFVSTVWPAGADRRRVRRLLWAVWAVLLLGTVAGIAVQAAEADAAALDSTFGRVWLLRALTLLPVMWLLARLDSVTKAWWRVDAVALGTILVATPAFSGHADSGRWLGVAKVVDIIHVGAAAVWIGGLVALLTGALRRDIPDAKDVAERFSPIAFGAVAVVVATGLVQSVRQVTSLDALETSYGRLLAVKIVIVLGLIGVASLTRSALQGRLRFDDDPVAVGPGAMAAGAPDVLGVLRRLVVAEVVIGVAVIGVTALLVDANPGYAGTASAGPFDETVVVDDVLINVVAVPGAVGPTDIHVYVDDPSGGLAPPVDATGTLSLPGSEVTGIDVPFVAAGPSHWSANDVDIPIAGEWELELEVLLTDVDRVTATFTIPIGGSP